MFQNKIYNAQPKGIEGEYADDSPRRDTSFILLANSAEGAAATGSLAFTAQPTAGDTVTIGNQVYTFAATATQPYQVAIGANLAATLTNLVNTINGEENAPENANATASVTGSTVTLTATNTGFNYNAVALATSNTTNVTVTAFAGGTDGVERLPKFACAFTYGTDEGTAILGGEGVFAGILVNPKMYANFKNLQPTLNLPSGAQGSLCTFGHIFVRPFTAFAVGNVAAYDKTTGAINAYTNADAVPASSVLIPNAKFIEYSGDAGTVAVLELGN